jgi:hypothetical protein
MFVRITAPLVLTIAASAGAGEPARDTLPALAWPAPATSPAQLPPADALAGSLATGELNPASPPPRVADLPAAIRALFTAPNHRWVTVSQTTPGPFPTLRTEGKTERDGWSVVTRSGDGPDLHFARQGNAVVLREGSGPWLSPAESRRKLASLGARGTRGTLLGLGATSPALVATSLAGKLSNLRVEGSAILGSAQGPAAAQLLSPAGSRGPAAPAARVTGLEVRFWFNAGVLSKFEVLSRALVTGPDSTERELETVVVTEFKDVGSTRVEVPPGARAALAPRSPRPSHAPPPPPPAPSARRLRGLRPGRRAALAQRRPRLRETPP